MGVEPGGPPNSALFDGIRAVLPSHGGYASDGLIHMAAKNPAEADHRAALVAFGQRVRQLRHEAGLTQVELAEASGIDRAALSTIESGKRDLGVSKVFPLAAALGVAADRLFATSPGETVDGRLD
ncbi:MAG TPA: helix-turn-helix transcriptional regulator [Jatrophihabitans sp.]|nr:helix-turn-helix transcriptional regulator [Jatrophihabitans sp.]